MKADVTLHRSARHADAFIITAIALAAATVIALLMQHSSSPPPAAPVRAEQPVLQTPTVPEVSAGADIAPAPTAPRSAHRAAEGVPLDAAASQQPDGYEILSATELDGISQAKH
jgi:hypothetical protein